MSVDASVGALFDALAFKLQLRWEGGRRGDGRCIEPTTPTDKSEHSLVGHLNLIHPHRVQVLGKVEIDHIVTLEPERRRSLVDRLFSGSTDLVLIGDDLPAPDDLRQRAAATSTPVFLSRCGTQTLVNYVQYYLTNLFAERITLHGVFMDVFSLGVLITGSANMGKSELALELVARGHRLVADDAPIFVKTAPDILTGSCPDVLRDFLEVRGLGILDIRALFGDSAIKYRRNLGVILTLAPMSEEEIHKIDRLHGNRSERTILGVDVPEITLPVAPGRNLAVLAEAAARSHLLYLRGIDSATVFIDRQSSLMDNG
jgi:HPr kinase/phosphorylase